MHALSYVYVCEHVCMCVCVQAYLQACMHARMRGCVLLQRVLHESAELREALDFLKLKDRILEDEPVRRA